MINRKQNKFVILLFALIFLISTTVVSFGSQSVEYTTNGNAAQYVSGSVLVLYGKIEDSGTAVPNTAVIVDIKDIYAKVIYYGQLKTDINGYFKTNFTIPAGVSGSMNVKINTTEGNKVDVNYSLEVSGDFEFTGYVPTGYQEGKNLIRISANTERIGLVFDANVNYFNNKNSNLGLASLGINERNRDCVNIYEKNSQGNYVLVPSTMEMASSDAVGNTQVSGITYISDTVEQKDQRKDILFLVPSNGLKSGTTYKVVIDGDLSANNSSTLGHDEIVYFTTYSASSGNIVGNTTSGGITTGGITTPAAVSFGDIGNHWAKSAIIALAEQGIIKGVLDTEFAPERAITRAEFSVLLSRILKLNTTVAQNEFSDITDAAWFKDEVLQAAAAGIIMGDNGKFRPNEQISRQEMALMLARAYSFAGGNSSNGLDIEYVDEADIPEWALTGITQVSALKMMNGYPDGNFGGSKSSTRAEAAKTLKAFMDIIE